MECIDIWLGDYPDGQARFDWLGVECKCTLEPKRGDCYFGYGLTARLAFEAARRGVELAKARES